MRILARMILVFAACGPVASSTTTGDATTTSTTGTSTTASTPDTQPTGDPAASTTTTIPASTGAGSDDTAFMFFLEPDHPDSWCDLLAQDCPPGQKCSFFSENIYRDQDGVIDQRCVPLAPDPRQPDELCHFNEPGIGLDDCAAGSFCMPYYSDGAGTSLCVSVCGGSLDRPTCPDEHSCVIPEGGLFWCAFTCNDLLQNCADGLTCLLGSCGLTSEGTFDRPPGAACESLDDCVPASFCSPAKFVTDCVDERCCTEFCDLRAPSACALPGQSCQPIPDELSLDWFPDSTGMCVLP